MVLKGSAPLIHLSQWIERELPLSEIAHRAWVLRRPFHRGWLPFGRPALRRLEQVRRWLLSRVAMSDYIFSLSISSLSLKNCSRTLLMKSRTQQGGRYPELRIRRMFSMKSGSMPISDKRRLNWLVSRLRRYVSQKWEESWWRSFVITVDLEWWNNMTIFSIVAWLDNFKRTYDWIIYNSIFL